MQGGCSLLVPNDQYVSTCLAFLAPSTPTCALASPGTQHSSPGWSRVCLSASPERWGLTVAPWDVDDRWPRQHATPIGHYEDTYKSYVVPGMPKSAAAIASGWRTVSKRGYSGAAAVSHAGICILHILSTCLATF